ncbi:MAG: malonic semialdehyde reductase, partial [Novosphingobium sp.]
PLPDPCLDQLFREAHTAQRYLDKPVTVDQARVIWDLAKMGPTSANMLPARLVWCLSQDSRDALAELALASNAGKIRAAPAAVIIGMDLDFHEQLPWLYPPAPTFKQLFEGADKEALRRDNALRNSSLQGAYFILAARALGLGVGPMSGFDAAAVDAAFFADQPRVRSNFIATFGYADPATFHPRSPRPDFETFSRIV